MVSNGILPSDFEVGNTLTVKQIQWGKYSGRKQVPVVELNTSCGSVGVKTRVASLNKIIFAHGRCLF